MPDINNQLATKASSPKNPPQLNLRVEVPLRKAFQQVAKKNDLTASQAIRALMRDYVAKHAAERQSASPK